MAVISKEFDKYSINYASRKLQTVSGLSKTNATINCYDSVKKVTVGLIEFSDLPVPDNTYQNDTIIMNFDISQFNDVLSILRYEKPLKIYFDENLKKGTINTDYYEPVGEQEGV